MAADLGALAGTGRDHDLIALALHNHRSLPRELPESLRDLVAQSSVVPQWWDPDKARMAVQAFHRNSDTVLAGLALGGIPIGFSTLISKSFRIRSRLVTNGVRRLKQNLRQLLEQFLPGGNEPGGDAWKLSLRTRIVHAQSRRLIQESDEWDTALYGTPLSASHMNLGAANFSGGLMLYVMMLGGDFTDEERDAYAHVWRYTGMTMGIPETILFTDQESALEVARIGAKCEPPADEDSIIMANSIVNSAPLLLGISDPNLRRAKARYFYKISRELMGDEVADQLRFPPKHRIKVIPVTHLLTKLSRRMNRFPVLSELLLRKRFELMLNVSDLGRLDYTYHLPTTVIDEESGDW